MSYHICVVEVVAPDTDHRIHPGHTLILYHRQVIVKYCTGRSVGGWSIHSCFQWMQNKHHHPASPPSMEVLPEQNMKAKKKGRRRRSTTVERSSRGNRQQHQQHTAAGFAVSSSLLLPVIIVWTFANCIISGAVVVTDKRLDAASITEQLPSLGTEEIGVTSNRYQQQQQQQEDGKENNEQRKKFLFRHRYTNSHLDRTKATSKTTKYEEHDRHGKQQQRHRRQQEMQGQGNLDNDEEDTSNENSRAGNRNDPLNNNRKRDGGYIRDGSIGAGGDGVASSSKTMMHDINSTKTAMEEKYGSTKKDETTSNNDGVGDAVNDAGDDEGTTSAHHENENSKPGNKDDKGNRDRYINHAITNLRDDISATTLDIKETYSAESSSFYEGDVDDEEGEEDSDSLYQGGFNPSFGDKINVFDGIGGDFMAEALNMRQGDGMIDGEDNESMLTLYFSMSPVPTSTPEPTLTTAAPSVAPPSSTPTPTTEIPTTSVPTASDPTPEPTSTTTTMTPQQTSAPSIDNCENTPRQEAIAELIRPFTPTESLTFDTPQGQAFQWIVEDDPAQVDPCTDPLQIVQRYALATIYFATGGESWTSSTAWLTGADECNWEGVVCSSPSGFDVVNLLLLPSNNLSGSLPSEVEALTELRTIDVSSNMITGSIPPGARKLSNLQSLNVEMNMISGSITSDFGMLTALTDLNLAENAISGSLPTTIGDIESLVTLRLDRNQLFGSIPTTIGALSQLKVFTADGNKFTGFIPEEMWTQTTLLETLILSNNALTGTLSNSIGDMHKLQDLVLSSNQIGGWIPVLLGRLSNLVQLDLGNNELVGTIRDSFTSFTNLRSFDFSLNNLSGSIPTRLFDLTSLAEISLNGNNLDGRLPENMGNAAGLEMLYLDSNTLTGTVPNFDVGQLSNLSVMHLHDNQLEGSMAASICALRNEGVGVLDALWTDCGDNASPRLECDLPECCTWCFPEGLGSNAAEGIVSNR